MHERSSLLFETGDLSAPPGSPEWVKAVHFEAKAALNDNNASKELVERWVGSLRQDDRFRCLADSNGHPYRRWSAFCKDRQPWGLGYSEQAIDAILAERSERHGAITNRDKSITAAANTTGEVDKEGRPAGNSAICRVSSQSRRALDNGVGYRTQVKLDILARDFPEQHEKVKAGEMSVNAACIAAGIEQRKVSIPLDPGKAAAVILRHFKGDSLDALMRALEAGRG